MKPNCICADCEWDEYCEVCDGDYDQWLIDIEAYKKRLVEQALSHEAYRQRLIKEEKEARELFKQ
jgi:hypothetical protein